MTCRRYGTRPTVAFWMLVALADVALIVASVGPAVLFLVLAVALTAVVGWRVVRRGGLAPQSQAAPATVPVESRRTV